MQAKTTIFDRLSTLKNLPSLPHVLLRLFEACDQDSVDLDEIAALVGKDPSLSAKILKLVNSAFFGLPQKVHSINQAVVLVGTKGIKNMAICACVYEAFPKPKKKASFNLKAFWWHSLTCAFLARNIATEMKFDQPDEVFISGLLHDIGKLVLWVNCHDAYDAICRNCAGDAEQWIEEKNCLGATHCEVAAWLLDRWKFQPSICDPVRYHHESPTRIAQALPMVQIVWTANLLSHGSEDQRTEGVLGARQVLGLTPDTCHALVEKSDQEARDVAEALGIDINTDMRPSAAIDEKDHQIQNALVQDVREVALLMGTLEGFLAANDQNDILNVIAEGLKILLDVDRWLYLLLDPKKNILYGYAHDEQGRYIKKHSIAVAMSQDQCLPVRAINENKPLDSFNPGAQHPLTILDNQIVGLLGAEGIYCLPLIAHGDTVGALVLAVRSNDLAHLLKRTRLLEILIHKGALALRVDHLRHSRLQEIQAKGVEASSDLARKVVHEVNNPLSIIKNYLKIFELKLAGTDIARDEIKIINEEISRVARLLRKLTQFSTQKVQNHEATDINALIMDIVKLTKDSLLRISNIKLHLDLDPELPRVTADKAGLKQVFINLMKNAAEAIESGGNIRIQTRHLPPPIDGSRQSEDNGSIQMRFEDDGPGVPDAIKEKLFDPYVGSKKDGHSGLGLSIVYNIVKSSQGNITCASAADKGTVFNIELPVKGDS